MINKPLHPIRRSEKSVTEQGINVYSFIKTPPNAQYHLLHVSANVRHLQGVRVPSLKTATVDETASIKCITYSAANITFVS